MKPFCKLYIIFVHLFLSPEFNKEIIIQFLFFNAGLSLMHTSPLHRFQRTRPLHMSPNPFRNPQSPKVVDLKSQQNHKISKQIHTAKSCQGSPQISVLNQQVQDKITNLQKMLQTQKAKRQTQFGELFKMINNLKNGQKLSRERDEPKFAYKQQQFPMTPRVRPRQNDEDNSSQQFNNQTYTPIYETVSKVKSKNLQKQQQCSLSKSFQEFSIKSLQILLLKIQRETQYNNRNFSKINQQISSIRTALTRTKQYQTKLPKNQQIPIQMQKYLKDTYSSIKSNFQVQKTQMQNFIVKKISQKVQQNFKMSKQNKNIVNNNREQINQIQKKLKLTNSHFQQQLKALQQRTSSQIFVLNDIIQQKFAFFKDSLLDQIIKDNKESSNKMIQQIEKQKKRVDEIQQYNGQFFNQLEKTMENIQQKLKITRQIGFQHQRNQGQIKIQQVKNFIEKQKQHYFDQINSSFSIKLNQNTQKFRIQIKKLANRLQKLEETRLIKSTVDNSINTEISVFSQHNNQKNTDLGQNYKQQSIYLEKQKKIQQNEFSTQIKNKINQMMELISENCNYLQTRNCTIEQSLGQVIWVLNDIVQKLKHIM